MRIRTSTAVLAPILNTIQLQFSHAKQILTSSNSICMPCFPIRFWETSHRRDSVLLAHSMQVSFVFWGGGEGRGKILLSGEWRTFYIIFRGHWNIGKDFRLGNTLGHHYKEQGSMRCYIWGDRVTRKPPTSQGDLIKVQSALDTRQLVAWENNSSVLASTWPWLRINHNCCGGGGP